MNHNVLITGYGVKDGKNVWVVKNSWGESWGDKGYFFVEIGKDSFCMEHLAIYGVPKFYDFDDGAINQGEMVRNETFELEADDLSDKPFYFVNKDHSRIYLHKCPNSRPYAEVIGECVPQCASKRYFLEETV